MVAAMSAKDVNCSNFDMDDCGSRTKQLEQLLSEYQDRLQLDEDSDFAEGISPSANIKVWYSHLLIL